MGAIKRPGFRRLFIMRQLAISGRFSSRQLRRRSLISLRTECICRSRARKTSRSLIRRKRRS